MFTRLLVEKMHTFSTLQLVSGSKLEQVVTFEISILKAPSIFFKIITRKTNKKIKKNKNF